MIQVREGNANTPHAFSVAIEAESIQEAVKIAKDISNGSFFSITEQ